MHRKHVCLIFVVLLGMVGDALAADVDWTNGGGDRLWRNAANWNVGVPTADDKAAIRQGGDGPIVDSSTTAVANVVVLSDWSSFGDSLDMTGGSLTTNSWFIIGYGANNDGTFNVSGGVATIGTDLRVGFKGAGGISMTGGSIKVNGAFRITDNEGSSGEVLLDGGTISCGSFSMQTGATMDIAGGALIVSGNAVSSIDSYVSNGWLSAYGGVGTLEVDYDTLNPGETTVTAFMPSEAPTKAANPIPSNDATGASMTPMLSWTTGLYASSRDVYFGDNHDEVFNADNSLPVGASVYMGEQTAGTFSPGILDINTQYFWRIDEKNAIGTSTGDVWSFTTTTETSYSLIGKVMCGYQGWFSAPGDGANRGWVHWGGSGGFSPTKCTVDMWPDMTEMGPGEKFLASEFYDGTDRYVFSSHNYNTVVRHFKWMKDYGIDGVYLQRFASSIKPGSTALNHRNNVLDYCKAGANLYGRKYAVMYDLSGLGTGADLTARVVNDWKFLVDEKLVGRDPLDGSYMTHNGRPVVAVWGLGFNRSYEGQESYEFINLLKNDPVYGGFTVMLGVDDDWRTNSDAWFQQTLQLGDVISPWMVGRYSNTNGINNWANNKGSLDKDWCDTNGKEYLPVMFPGFSWYNLKGGTFNQIPRRGGQFLWDQVKANISTVGAKMLYVAMFDEVDEGTAIFKVTNDPPVVSPAKFVTYDIDGYPLPSDEYLWLVGQATRGLRGEIPVNQTRPIREQGPVEGASARGENLPNETADKAFDGDINTKWLDFSPGGSWIQYKYADDATAALSQYAITSANDKPERDPMDWNLLGSNDDGDTWDTLDSRTGETFSNRFETRRFSVDSPGAYNIYRLEILAVFDVGLANSVQIAEIEFIEKIVTWADLSIDSDQIVDTATVSIPVTLSSGGSIAALSFTLGLDSTVVELVSIELGDAANDAGKTMTVTELDSDNHFIDIGGNYTVIADGVVATLNLKAAATGENGQCSDLLCQTPESYATDDSVIETTSNNGASCLELQIRPGDVDQNGRLNASDIQLVINRALGIPVAHDCDINNDGAVNATDVQLVINAVLGMDISGALY